MMVACSQEADKRYVHQHIPDTKLLENHGGWPGRLAEKFGEAQILVLLARVESELNPKLKHAEPRSKPLRSQVTGPASRTKYQSTYIRAASGCVPRMSWQCTARSGLPYNSRSARRARRRAGLPCSSTSISVCYVPTLQGLPAAIPPRRRRRHTIQTADGDGTTAAAAHPRLDWTVRPRQRILPVLGLTSWPTPLDNYQPL